MEASEMFRRAFEREPGSVPSRVNYASSLMPLGKYDEAIEHFEAALVSSPDSALIHNQLGLALQARGDLDDAVGHFERAIAVDPRYSEARANLNAARTRPPDAEVHR